MLAAGLALIDSGKKQDFEAFFNRYKGQVYAAAYSVLGDSSLAEDAAMEAFIYLAQVFDKVCSLEPPRCRRYVYLVSRNKAYDLLRCEKRSEADAEYSDELASSVSLSEYDKVQLRDCISRLDRRDSELLYLRYSLGLEYRELASLYGITEPAARKRMQQARQRLKRLLEEG